MRKDPKLEVELLGDFDLQLAWQAVADYTASFIWLDDGSKWIRFVGIEAAASYEDFKLLRKSYINALGSKCGYEAIQDLNMTMAPLMTPAEDREILVNLFRTIIESDWPLAAIAPMEVEAESDGWLIWTPEEYNTERLISDILTVYPYKSTVKNVEGVVYCGLVVEYPEC